MGLFFGFVLKVDGMLVGSLIFGLSVCSPTEPTDKLGPFQAGWLAACLVCEQADWLADWQDNKWYCSNRWYFGLSYGSKTRAPLN